MYTEMYTQLVDYTDPLLQRQGSHPSAEGGSRLLCTLEAVEGEGAFQRPPRAVLYPLGL